MPCDRKVEFLGHEFECVDEGFAPGESVDVVLRPEDIYIMKQLGGAQFSGKVTSCTFKGVFYDIYVTTDNGSELLIQDYNAFEVGSEVGMLIKPQDIQVMHKRCTQNEAVATVADRTHLLIWGEEFECRELSEDKYPDGSEVKVAVAFDKTDLQDNQEDGTLWGEVTNILYKGDHYHLRITLDTGETLFADTQDVWDRGDLVGVKIAPKDIKIIG